MGDRREGRGGACRPLDRHRGQTRSRGAGKEAQPPRGGTSGGAVLADSPKDAVGRSRCGSSRRQVGAGSPGQLEAWKARPRRGRLALEKLLSASSASRVQISLTPIARNPALVLTLPDQPFWRNQSAFHPLHQPEREVPALAGGAPAPRAGCRWPAWQSGTPGPRLSPPLGCFEGW